MKKSEFIFNFVLVPGFFAVILVSLGRIIMKRIWRRYNFGICNVVLIGDEDIVKNLSDWKKLKKGEVLPEGKRIF